MNRSDFFKTLFALIFLVSFTFQNANSSTLRKETGKPDTLRVFLIGNSFSQNATLYLPKLAKEGGHCLILGRAEIPGCPLDKHWRLASLAEANPNDPEGKPYHGQSLRMLLSQGKWDIVTLQQASILSGDYGTYFPYIQKLYDLIKSIQPDARIVIHQTWAYRKDSKDFTKISKDESATTEKEMWKKSRAAYKAAAAKLGVKIIPVGDAFWEVNSSKKWAFQKDMKFKEQDMTYPNLPDQKYSLHRGYYWDNHKKIIFDTHHANDAGCYLGALVWYSFLFGESTQNLKFVPAGIPEDFAGYLKKVADAQANKHRK